MRKFWGVLLLITGGCVFVAYLAIITLNAGLFISVLIFEICMLGSLLLWILRLKWSQIAEAAKSKSGRVFSPPGWGLLRFAETCFSKKTFTQVLEPTLSDMQKEHFDALAEGYLWKARLALVRGYVSFWSAVAAQAPLSILSLLYKVWKATKTGS